MIKGRYIQTGKRTFAIFLTVAMLFSFVAAAPATALAASGDIPNGNYTIPVSLWHASSNQASMGNAALEQTAKLTVADGQGALQLTFKSLFYLNQEGYLSQLDLLDNVVFNEYNYPVEYDLIPAAVVSTYDVVDNFNKPDGTDPKVAGKPYPKELSVPVALNQEYTWVHVYVPVMGSMGFGDQVARIKLNWSGLNEVGEPEPIVITGFEAVTLDAGTAGSATYASAAEVIAALPAAVTIAGTSVTVPVTDWTNTDNYNPAAAGSYTFTATLGEIPVGYANPNNLTATAEVVVLEESTPVADKTALIAKLSEAKAIVEENYTQESYAALQTAVTAAQAVADKTGAAQEEVEAQVTALTKAIGELVNIAGLKDRLTLAKACRAQKDKYTADSYAASGLEAAITAAQAVLSEDGATKEQISAQVNALNTAMGKLVLRPASQLDKDNLADGIYSVYGEMIKISRAEHSMSNAAISHNIKLEVEDGKYYVTLDFKGLAIESFFGYLGNLKYYDAGFTYNSSGQPQGTLLPATVLSTQKDGKGNDVIDQYNSSASLYPDLVRFPLVNKASFEGNFVPLQVFVPIMEAIGLDSGNPGMGTQNVLLKLDWSTLKIADEGDFEPDDPPERSPAFDATDAASGVKIHAGEGVLPEGAALKVKQITSGADYNKAKLLLADVGKKFRLYDIALHSNGAEIQPNGLVKVSLPIPEGYDASKLALYRINDDGTKTLIESTVENGYVVFYTKHFSLYALVEKGSAGGAGNENAVPETGSNEPSILWRLIMFAVSASLLAALAAGRKRRAHGAGA